MAGDAVRFIRALGFDQVDLLGLSMGGFIAQVIAGEEPRLVRKVILAGTGPAGGHGIDKVPALTIQATLKGALTARTRSSPSSSPGPRTAGRQDAPSCDG
ncbi:alpha/beta fold hydrolase [Streptomyces adelaidensis]|uniref:alpha/beta fold hydrolase n=1 Tax=Streptomyces adelaidensis TaxID=2796465 RepID=UPI001F2CB85B|nr:alpha/beta hydrolase [Streptomyces adelaidensis]